MCFVLFLMEINNDDEVLGWHRTTGTFAGQRKPFGSTRTRVKACGYCHPLGSSSHPPPHPPLQSELQGQLKGTSTSSLTRWPPSTMTRTGPFLPAARPPRLHYSWCSSQKKSNTWTTGTVRAPGSGAAVRRSASRHVPDHRKNGLVARNWSAPSMSTSVSCTRRRAQYRRRRSATASKLWPVHMSVQLCVHISNFINTELKLKLIAS